MKRKKILLVEPEKSKKYHTPYPPLGLLKLSAYHKKRGDKVDFARGIKNYDFNPDKIYITSLFTYAYEPVHDVINYYGKKFKKAKVVVGGIYATLCEDHLKNEFKNRIEIFKGIMEEVENILPDYSLVPEFDASILFSSRGCVRKCNYCSVPIIEPKFKAKKSIKHLVYPSHKKVILWDNNILASPYWEDIYNELLDLNVKVDFNQGLDARFIDENVAMQLRNLKIPLLRLAYDNKIIMPYLKDAINKLKDVGIRGREIFVYCLYNHLDSPEEFLTRIKEIINLDVVAYPMRYEPLVPKPKNTYIGKLWTIEQLEMLAKARRVIGYGGAFPPYEGFRKKIFNAKNFEKAFRLRQ